MKPGQEETTSHELVIIRRRGSSEEGGHHGGVWKIAYADFMTAMMAFFLVMWLINAADKKTITQVATYFNPLRLSDKNTDPRGVHDLRPEDEGEDKKQKQHNEKQPKGKGDEAKGEAKKDSGTPQFSEEELFSDPYGVLAKLAAQAGSKLPQPKGNVKQTEEDVAGGEAYRDPFDPAFRRESTAASPPPAIAEAQPPRERLLEQAQDARDDKAPEQEQAAEGKAPPSPPPAEIAAAPRNEVAASPQAGQEVGRQSEAAKLESEIRQALKQPVPGNMPHLEVTETDEGVLISLTDEFDFGMFAIASAEPRPELVTTMEKIAKVIAMRPGNVTVRGHTDGRPFRSGTYDNWRLSTARAHVASLMLTRAGIDEKRIERIEGYADRRLKVPKDPGAAQNRRIEILLRKVAQ